MASKTILYEVNLEVDKSQYESYLKWLHKFFEEKMLKIDGFLSAEVFVVESIGTNPNPEKLLLAVHYVIENEEKFASYLKIQQNEVSKQGAEYGWTVLSRRVLRSKDKQFKQSKEFGYVF